MKFDSGIPGFGELGIIDEEAEVLLHRQYPLPYAADVFYCRSDRAGWLRIIHVDGEVVIHQATPHLFADTQDDQDPVGTSWSFDRRLMRAKIGELDGFGKEARRDEIFGRIAILFQPDPVVTERGEASEMKSLCQDVSSAIGEGLIISCGHKRHTAWGHIAWSGKPPVLAFDQLAADIATWYRPAASRPKKGAQPDKRAPQVLNFAPAAISGHERLAIQRRVKDFYTIAGEALKRSRTEIEERIEAIINAGTSRAA